MVKPAKVYRGMASSAKLFMPSNMRWAMVTVLPPQEQDAADGGQAQTHGDGHAQKQQNEE